MLLNDPMLAFSLYLLTALALICIIEGLIYAFFPEGVQRFFAMALRMRASYLRLFGSAVAVSGFCLLLILRAFSGG